VAISNTIVASTIAIVYISVSGLLLITASNDYNHQQRVNKKAYLSVVIPIPLVMLLLYKKTSIVLIGKAEGLNYRELFGITLVISLIFIFIISGLISLFSKEN
jgi:hypothetical protein